jgi:hypothetical protein
MNAKEHDFAYKVRHALNENLDQVSDSAAARLAAARRQALARKKSGAPLPVLAARRRLALGGGGFFHAPSTWFGRMGLILPAIVLAAGLAGIYHEAQLQRLADIAEIDALVMADELPLSAYADHGFNAFLAKRAE